MATTKRPWARARTAFACTLPGHYDKKTGERTMVPPYVELRLINAGLDDEGLQLWKVPELPPGAHIEVGPLAPGHRLIQDIPRPHQPKGLS